MPSSRNDKLPPQNTEAEQSVLGAILIDSEAIIKIADILKPEHFYRGKHQKIFESILALFERREPADIITVGGELAKKNELDEVGGELYLAGLVDRVPTASNVLTYAELVREAALKRELISLSSQMNESAYGGGKTVKEMLEETETKIFGLTQRHLTRNFVPIRDTLVKSFDRLEELHQNKSGVRGVPTGFRDIDNKLSGLQDSNLVILAARPSMGKTSLALNISEFVSVHQQVPVGYFSLESSRDELVDRLLASQSQVDYWKITTGNVNEDDMHKIADAMGLLADAPLFIDDTPGLSIMEMRSKARRLQLEHGVRLIVVDYLQLAVSRNLENRVQEVSEISQGLKNIARELGCPVLALSQLSRQVEQRGEHKPQLSDLRDSGSIEQDADVVLFIWKPSEEESQGPGHTRLSISKHRNGPTGEIDLKFIGERARFYSMEKQREE